MYHLCPLINMKFSVRFSIGRARYATKMNLRGERIEWLKANRSQDLQTFLQYVKDPKIQAGLEFYIQSLKNKAN